MVGQARSFKGASAFNGSGFRVQFERPDPGPLDILARDAVVVRGASIDAVYETTEQTKEAIRDYIDAHFGNSEFHGNGRRRVSNASAQSTYYNEIDEKGQYAGLVYSKFGYRGAGGFVDFLLLHVRGGTIRPKRGNWLKLRADGVGFTGQTGFFSGSQADNFFRESSDGQKLYQFRRFRKRDRNNPDSIKLLATLVRKVEIPARLSGIDLIAARRGELFERNFLQALQAREGSEV